MASLWDTPTPKKHAQTRTYHSQQTHNHTHTQQPGTRTQTLHTRRCKHLQGEEEVCDELNERSEQEDVMERWVFLPSGAPRESRAGPITETNLDTHSHMFKLHTRSHTPDFNLRELGEYNYYYQIQGEQIFGIKKCKSQSLYRCSNSSICARTHTLIHRLQGDAKERAVQL